MLSPARHAAVWFSRRGGSAELRYLPRRPNPVQARRRFPSFRPLKRLTRYPGGFNRSAQHLLILRGEEVCHGDVTDLVHGSTEGRAVGAMEERTKCCGHLAGAGKEEQDRR